MPGLPDGYSIRPATMNDVDAVADVLAAEDLTITGEVLYDADFVRFQWTKPGVDLAKDAWVVESGPSVIGHAIAIPDGDEVVTSWGVVLPRHRGVGVGPPCSTSSRSAAPSASTTAAGCSTRSPTATSRGRRW
ncbi:MAG TPA: hypothetical protein VJ913_05930 [Actinomycetota bacterium]|nr:hypothetical protein [Actinomycetota bacterium]